MPAPKGNKNAAKDGETQSERVQVRATESDLTLIDLAAKYLGQSRSKFMIESAVIAADKLLRDE